MARRRCYAAVGSGTSALEALLSHPSAVEAVALADKSGATALHDALRAGKMCAANAQLLIAKSDALVKAADLDGFTPLYLAMAAGLEDVSETLLAKGAARSQRMPSAGRPISPGQRSRRRTAPV